MKAKFLILLLASGILLQFGHFAPSRVNAVSSIPVVHLFANFSGWNSTVGTSNPTFTEFVAGTVNVTAEFDDGPGILHDFAIYANGTTSASTGDTCSTSNTNGCLVKSAVLSTSNLVAKILFTPLSNAATFNTAGTGGYEYFCQYHPFSMHGHIKLYRRFVLLANVAGWNSTGTGGTNMQFREFVGTKFNVRIQFADFGEIHDFAIYVNATPAANVSPSDPCNLANTVGCVATTPPVSATSSTANLTLTPTSSALLANFGGGGFEYFCQYHPDSMHGHIIINKSLDADGDHSGKVDIVDIATIAFAFGSTALPSPSPKWNPAADIDNSGRVDILDVAIAAFYFGQTL